MNKTAKEKKKRAIADFRLEIINVFFTAYGAFISGLFCIAQYFFKEYNYFVCIVAGFFFVTLLISYILCYSKRTTNSEQFLKYIQECSNKVGVLSPILLAIGFLLTVTSEIYILILCIILEALQLIGYIFSFKKVSPNIKITLLQKMKNWCKNNSPLLVTISFTIATGFGWLFTSDELKISDLCLNLLAGFIASSITIGVIDRIIRKQQAIKDNPIKKALYRDVQLFTSRLISFWQEMYVQSTENRTQITIEELFAPSNIIEIGGNLDLNGFPNVTPEQNWFTYIEHQRKDLSVLGEKILSTYINIAEPEVFQSIHYLTNDSSYLGYLRWVNATHACDISYKIPRPTLLGWYNIPPQETDYVMIKQLISWCRNQFDVLRKNETNKNVGVYPIPERISIINPNSKPSSIMSEETKVAAFNTFKKWQDESNLKP